MEPAGAFERAFRSVQDDLRDYIHAVNPSKPNADLLLRLERIQSDLAAELRDNLTDLDPFQREGIIRMTLEAFRKALTTAGLINDRTSMRLAHESVAKVGVVVQARVEDQRFATRRDEAMAQLVSDGVIQWTWQATLDKVTCLFCISRNGTTYPVGVPMLSHPNCRCIPIAGDRRLASGQKFLERLSKKDRRTVMGPRRAEAFEQGRPLSDMVDEAKRGVIPLRDFKTAFPPGTPGS